MYEEDDVGTGWSTITDTIDALAGTAARTYATVNNPTGIGYTYSRTGGAVQIGGLSSLLIPIAIIVAVVLITRR